MVVLLTYQPEIHGGSDKQFQPKAPDQWARENILQNQWLQLKYAFHYYMQMRIRITPVVSILGLLENSGQSDWDLRLH